MMEDKKLFRENVLRKSDKLHQIMSPRLAELTLFANATNRGNFLFSALNFNMISQSRIEYTDNLFKKVLLIKIGQKVI
jgi:hypothetical protein